MSRILYLLIPLLFVLTTAHAQQADTLAAAKPDTVLMPSQLPPVPVMAADVDTTPFVTPKKTALFSAIVPGLGQYYNKHYWKIPVIYALVGTAIYFVNDNLKNYNAFRKELAGRRNNPSGYKRKFPQYEDEGTLQSAQDYYRRNLDLTILLTGVGYTLQVIDAVVFAHLKGFDISEDISIRYRPVAMPNGGLGFGLVMNF